MNEKMFDKGMTLEVEVSVGEMMRIIFVSRKDAEKDKRRKRFSLRPIILCSFA